MIFKGLKLKMAVALLATQTVMDYHGPASMAGESGVGFRGCYESDDRNDS